MHCPSTAAGNPTAPTSVILTRGLSSLAGTFTLPADPCYMTLSYRLAALGPVLPSGPGAPIMDWKQLSAQEIAAGAFSIPDPVSVGGSSVTIPIGRYQLDMRADASNGAAPAGEGERRLATKQAHPVVPLNACWPLECRCLHLDVS